MPRRGRSNIGRHLQNATRHRNDRARWSEEERAIERQSARIRMSANRERQSQEMHEAYNEQQRLRRREVRARLNDEARSQRATIQRQRRQQQFMPLNIERAAFRYDPNIQYSAHPSVQFGEMSVVCQHCNALKFEKEPPGLCCAGGKVKLPELLPPPEPLRTLLYGESPNTNHFLKHIKMYNDCFQMTSFGAEIVNEQRYNPTFKVILSNPQVIPPTTYHANKIQKFPIFPPNYSDSWTNISSCWITVASSRSRTQIFTNILSWRLK